MLNILIDDLSMTQLLEKLDSGVVFTLNLDHIYHLQRNQAFYDAYNQADFVTCDSKYVFWSLGWIGRRIQQTVSGSDLVPAYCAHHGQNPQVKVFLLGAAPGIAQKALEAINSRVGRDVVVKAQSPSMNFVNDESEIAATIRIVNDSGATCLIIGLGAPKQEIWIIKHRHLMPKVKVYMGVGATIDRSRRARCRRSVRNAVHRRRPSCSAVECSDSRCVCRAGCARHPSDSESTRVVDDCATCCGH